MNEETVVRTPQFEILTSKIGAFLVVRIRGRYVDDLLVSLRRGVFSQKSSFALDLSGLADVTMPLAREIYFMAQNLRSGEHRLVLLNPPEKILSLLSLLSTVPVPAVHSEKELDSDPAVTDARAADHEREVARIRAEIQNSPLWQQFLRDGGWVCPYCGRMQEGILIVSRSTTGPGALEGIYRHLWFQCPLFRPGAGASYRPLTELQGVLRTARAQRLSAARKDVEIMESKITVLEHKAKQADALEQSLKVASARQRRLLPDKPPKIAGVEIGILYRPAERVSGDFYDFVEFPDGRLGCLIGDVAGHGIEAAILMGMSKKVLTLRLEETGDPVETVRRANRDLYRELDRQLFVTAFVAVLDPAARKLSYARAGHNPPLLFRPPSTRQLDVGGLGLGMSQGTLFEKTLRGETVDLVPEDVLLLYTDGLVEAKNQAGEEFGVERMSAILEETRGKPCDFLLGVLGHEMDKFIAGLPQEDDVTALCFRTA